jgi:cyclopropane fatty-acyl-phospholipid synthase-like methyltransferase
MVGTANVASFLSGITRENLRHLRELVRQSGNPAAAVYNSLGPDFFLSPAPGWLNLGLWEGLGDEAEAETAVRRLVETVASSLPKGGTVLDVGNGLGAQDPVIAEVASPSLLVALNITESQLRFGKARILEADALAVAGDAVQIPLKEHRFDGVISIEAAFHFSSRARFFAESRRVLRAGGKLAMSDVSVERTRPKDMREAFAGVSNLRAWGIRRRSLNSAKEIELLLEGAGFAEVEIQRVGERTFPPSIRLFRNRLDGADVPAIQKAGANLLLSQWQLLYERHMMEYLLISATAV